MQNNQENRRYAVQDTMSRVLSGILLCLEWIGWNSQILLLRTGQQILLLIIAGCGMLLIS